MSRRHVVWAGLLAGLGCGAEPTVTPPPAEVEVLLGAPVEGQFALSAELPVGEAIEAIGVDDDGAVVLASADGVYVVKGDTLERRRLYVGSGDPSELGATRVIRPRASGGAFLGTTKGLFLLDQLYVTKSPLALSGAAIHDLIEQSSGPLAGLWLATDAGLFKKSREALEQLSIDGASGASTAIAIEAGGQFGLVVWGGALYVLEPAEAGLRSDRPPLDTGRIHALAAGRGVAWAATEKGLFRYDPKNFPSFRQYALAGTMEAALEIRDVSVDSTGATWALADGRLLLVESNRAVTYPAPGVVQAVVDRLGDVWAAAGTTLLRRGTSTGESVSFAADVKPWITTHCAACHRNQTQDFEDYQVMKGLAEASLERVRSGDMPRCAGGLRCEAEMRLAPSDYAILEQWIRYGLPE